MDFRRLNKQLPEVKNMSGGKGCISLVPLPKTDEVYAKTAFVVSEMGKFEFNRVPFGLAQVPAYFQRLINEVLSD